MDPEQQLINERLAKIDEMRKNKINPYPYSFDKKDNADELQEKFKILKPEEKASKTAQTAGRVMSIRNMGAIAFMHIQDSTGKIQLYFSKEILKDKMDSLRYFDMGDFIGAKGKVFRTKRGELSIEVIEFEMLSKAIRPMPEKFHGIADPEIKYRKRYLDLATDPEVKKVFVLRSKIVSAVREFLESKGFAEVEIPLLQPIYGGGKAKPFMTKINAWDMNMYLSISPELYLKRCIAGGFEGVYTICKNFRNEGVDKTHNPEFTMMECYWAYRDYNDMMVLTEELYEFVCKKVLGTTDVKYGDKTLNFRKPWQRISMVDAIKKYSNIDIREMKDKELQMLILDYKIKYEGSYNRGRAIEAIFDQLISEKLIQPTFITDHPKESTCLCKQKRDDAEHIERFEPYAMGWELGNAYSELNDPVVQKKLFEEQAEAGRGGDEEAHPMDNDFVTAMEHGMPPMGGLGLGIDRMAMLLTGAETIRDVILFPTMKPEKK
ncbi:MAG: lysine--tRNA ligase [Candidatus Nanoarchaeia archaeon]|nr:lysine--tRNA ligase [Candidatus Nanoarchaeia archaeon]